MGDKGFPIDAVDVGITNGDGNEGSGKNSTGGVFSAADDLPKRRGLEGADLSSLEPEPDAIGSCAFGGR